MNRPELRRLAEDGVLDAGALLDEGEKDAGAELIDRISETWPVNLAFWLKPADFDKWFLYIAAEGIGDSNLGQGYEEVLRRVKEMRTADVDPFREKLIKGDGPLARAAMEVARSAAGERFHCS